MDKFRIEYIDPKVLVDYELNSKLHPPEQIEALAREFLQVGFRVPIVIDSQGTIVQGHGRKLGAIKAGLEKVPVHRLPSDIPPERIRAMRLFDNRVSETGYDEKLLAEEIGRLAELPSFTPDLIGYTGDEVFALLPDDHIWVDGYRRSLGEGEGEEEGDEDPYTRKIESPIYTPKGECPEVRELFDDAKARELCERVQRANLPDDVKTFLSIAAGRHVVFDYQNIAEFYAHAPKDVQELMEESALVIIDFKKAIEKGFVVLTKELAEGYTRDEA